MNRRARIAVVATAAAALSSPVSAMAEHGHVDDQPGDGPPWYANITEMRVFHKEHRVAATLRIPVAAKRKLAETSLKIRRKGSRSVWTVTVSRDRRGKIVDKSIRVRRPDGLAGIVLGCDRRIHVEHGIEKVYLSVARRCLFGKHSDKPIRVKGRIVARNAPHKRIVDSTPYSELLSRG